MAKTKKQREAERQARIDQISKLMVENERELQAKARRQAEELDAITGMSLCMGYALQLMVREACKQTRVCGTEFGRRMNFGVKNVTNTVLPLLSRSNTLLEEFFEQFQLCLEKNANRPELAFEGGNQYTKWAHDIAELACLYMNSEMTCPEIMDLVRPTFYQHSTREGLFLSMKTIDRLSLKTAPIEAS